MRDQHTKALSMLHTSEGKKKLLWAEARIRQIYKESLPSKEDLNLRDKVILRIKDAFRNMNSMATPQELTGQVRISAFGSA